MDFFISFLEGIITFVSPCMLPMLPIYISYFAGGKESKKTAFTNSLGFVFGFTIVFVILGAFAGTLGRLLIQYSTWVNILTGLIVTAFGLNYLGVLNLKFLQNTKRMDYSPKNPSFSSSLLFGVIFSIGWTPCVGAFLGSALMLAASSQDKLIGIFMLLSFSLGLGIPFVFSAVIMDKLKNVFDLIKKNYKIVNVISGLVLVTVGVAMMTGMLGKFLLLFSN